MALELRPYRLALRRPLETGHGPIAERAGWWVAWHELGITGHGEIAPLPTHGSESEAEAAALLARLPADLAGLAALAEPATWRATLASLGLGAAPAARSGLELALWDARARLQGCSLAEGLGGCVRTRVPLTHLVAAPTPAGAVAEAARAVAAGYRTLKIKVGAGAPEQDLERLRAVRAHVGPGIQLRADANQAWSFMVAQELLPLLAPLELDLLEEPCSGLDLASWRALGEAGVPLGADESAARAEQALALVAGCAVAALVLKPSLLGGPGVVRDLARQAREAGVRVILTSALEGATGVLGALHLAATLPTPEAHGLATLSLFEDERQAAALRIEHGHALLPAGPGLAERAPWLA